jgi:hypothetical protein
MELNDLPDDLLLKIFFHLSLCSLNDISGLTLTCKKWRRILWSKEVFQRINSFKYQSRFLIYRCSPSNSVNENSLHEFLECDSHSTIPYLAVNHDSPNLKQDIKNCPLINMTVSMWCRTLNESPFMVDGTILLLWHFHLGYMGFHREGHGTEYALVKCTYTKQHLLNTTFRLELNKWYHVAIVIKEKEGLQLYINGNRVGDWALEENINKHNLLIAPDSSIWLASHCGVQKWSGSLSDICLWKRCLEPYEIKEMARTRTGIEKINFIPHICD